MADKKITDMSAAATLVGTELMEVVQSGTNVKAALTTLAALYQPLDSDLTAVAALSTTSYGRAFLALADQAALMGLLSSASTTAEGKVELATSAETITGTDTTRALTAAGGAAAYQPLDSDLTAIAALTTTSFGRSLLAAADATAERVLTEAAHAGPGYVTGDRTGVPWVTSSTRTVAQGNLFVVPFMARSTFTADRIAVEISTAGTASTVVRLGIWNHNASTGKPGTLLLDCGTVAGTALAEVAATISQSIPQGWCWLGCVGQTVTGSPAVRGFTNGLGPSPLQAQGVISSGLVPACTLLITGITGALATLVGATFSATSASGPQIQLRVG